MDHLTGRYPQSEWGKEWFGRGHEAGRLETLHANLREVLTARGWIPSAEEQERIASCQDADLLAEWHRRAIRAAALADVFVEKTNGH